MNYQGRNINLEKLWSRYVDFPADTDFSHPYITGLMCPNPDHPANNPHFQINTMHPLCHCFSRCGISGTWIHAISMIEGCNEREARRIILKSADGKSVPGISSKRRKRIQTDNRPAAIVRHDEFSTYIPAAGMEYLTTRGITAESIANFDIRWDSGDKRIVLPAKDFNGEIRFWIRRAVGSGWPKYLYSPEGCSKSSLLFGACNLDLGLIRSEGAILVEGSLDAVKLHQWGYRNTVAILGTGISSIQCEILSRLRPSRLFFFFDRDAAGVRNIELAARRLRKYPIRVCLYPSGKNDPAELTEREVGRCLSRSVAISKFMQRMSKPVRTGEKIGA